MSHRHRVAFLTSHPIQYQAPLFRVLARRPEVDLTVFFCSDQGARRYRDPGFATELAWDVPLLDGYRSVVLPNLNRGGGPGSFLGLVNARIVTELRHGRFDALIVHGWAHATSWLAFVAASVLGVPVILRGESNGLREPRGAPLELRRSRNTPSPRRCARAGGHRRSRGHSNSCRAAPGRARLRAIPPAWP